MKAPQVELPTEGGIYKKDGVEYTFTKAPTGATTPDPATGQPMPVFYTLRTWFSHGGPGWDYRFGLENISPDEMLRRYGHDLTLEEIFDPSQIPDSILYYKLVPCAADAN